jgi:hypothetical protein
LSTNLEATPEQSESLSMGEEVRANRPMTWPVSKDDQVTFGNKDENAFTLNVDSGLGAAYQ